MLVPHTPSIIYNAHTPFSLGSVSSCQARTLEASLTRDWIKRGKGICTRKLSSTCNLTDVYRAEWWANLGWLVSTSMVISREICHRPASFPAVLSTSGRERCVASNLTFWSRNKYMHSLSNHTLCSSCTAWRRGLVVKLTSVSGFSE